MEDAAVKMLEKVTDRKFITQVWDVFMDQWPLSSRGEWWDGVREVAISTVVTPERNIKLPIGGNATLVEFSTYSDETEFPETVSNYIFDTIGPRARVGLKIGGIWPTTVLRSLNAIRFRVSIGFGNAAAVPNNIKQAIKELVAHMYENRGDQNEMAIPPHVLALVSHYRREKLGR